MDKPGWYFLVCVHQFVQIDADRFELRLRPAMRFVACGLVIFGIAIIAGLGRVLTFDPVANHATRWFFGSAFAGLGVAFLFLKHFQFDTRTNTLTVLRWRFRVAQFPISSIVAVQVTHSPFRRSGQGRISRPAADGVSLLLKPGTDTQSVHLTFHSDKSATRKMAMQLSEVLQVPIDGPLPDVETEAGLGKSVRARQIAAKMCYSGAIASGVWFVALTVEQQDRDSSDMTLREVDAQLVERSVVERNAGSGDWYIRGVFDYTLEGEQVRAEGDLIPDQFYREHPGQSRDRRVPRQIVESMVGPWEAGKSYHAFIHIDYPTNIFFDRPPSGKETRTRRWQSAALAGALFVLGILASPGRWGRSFGNS